VSNNNTATAAQTEAQAAARAEAHAEHEAGLGAPGTAPGEAAPAPAPRQGEMPFAVVMGQAVTELPKDLYIPPQALEVFLEAFEGPLDLLLYLIRRQNLDILDIDVSAITEQYMQYVELMDAMQFELAAEYLLMAAMLAEIKSRMLLPRSVDVEADEEDPRAQLIRRLQEYERFKKAAEDIEELPRLERDNWIASAAPPEVERERPQPDVNMRELLVVLADVLRRAEMYESHHVQREALSTRERMSEILERLQGEQFRPLRYPVQGRRGASRRCRHLPGRHGADQGVPGGNRADREFRTHPRQGARRMSDASALVPILEAVLLAAGKPLTLAQIGELFDEHERPAREDLRAALDEVSERCEGRGYELIEVASGFRFQVREAYATWVGRLWQERPQRYSRACWRPWR
jgi:segregation and condensation protein A